MKQYQIRLPLLLCLFSLQLPLFSQTPTIIEQWNFTADSLNGENGTAIGGFFTNGGNADVPGNNTWTLNRTAGFSGDIMAPLNLNADNADIVTLSFTISSWNLSNGTSGEKFVIRLRNAASQVVAALEFRGVDTGELLTPQTGLAGNAYDGTPGGAFINGGILTEGRTGASPVTVGITLDMANETYTLWLGSLAGDDGSGWVNRYAGYTGTIAGLSLQTINSISFGWQNIGVGDFVEIDQITLEKTDLSPPLVQIVEQWDFTNNNLNGVNGTSASFLSASGNVDQTGGSYDNTYTVNRPGNFSADLMTPLDISAASTDTVTIQFTLAAWNLSHTAMANGGSGSAFGIRLRNVADQNVMFLQVRAFKDAGGVEYLRVQGAYYNGTGSGQFIQGGYAAAGLAGSTSITVGLTFDLVNETYTFWMGNPDTDDGSAWNTRLASYTGAAPGIGSQTIDGFGWALSPFLGTLDITTGDFIELDQVIFSKATAPVTTYAIAIGDVQVSGSNLVIDFAGTPGTTWTVRGGNNLTGWSDVSGSSAVVESPPGVYNATVPMTGNPFFVQFESP